MFRNNLIRLKNTATAVIPRSLLQGRSLLLFIILFAIILRFYDLGNTPEGIHADEEAWGYHDYSILKTGKDEYGKMFPVVLKSFGEYKGALYSYLTIPSIKVFGLTPFAVRLPSAIFSIFTIIILYFFTKRLLNNRKVALITAFIFTISPWDIFLGRIAGEHDLALFFIILFSFSLLKLIDSFSKKWCIVAGLSGILAINAYTAVRLFLPIIALIFIIFSFRKKGEKIIANKTIIFLALLCLVFSMIYNFTDSASRFRLISIASNPSTDLVMKEQIREDQFNPIMFTRFFHNKIINYSRSIFENFGEYFSLDFLFLHGGYPLRERVPDSGLLYIWQLPFLLLGIYFVFKKKNMITFLLFSWWILLLIPAAVTFDEIPNVQRSLIVFPIM